MNEVEVKQDIRRIMEYHPRRHPIKRRDLLVALGMVATTTNDRWVRKLIKDLRRGDSISEPFPILPCGNGYYLPQTEQDRQEGIEKYQSYIEDASITLHALKRGGIRYVEGDSQYRLV